MRKRNASRVVGAAGKIKVEECTRRCGVLVQLSYPFWLGMAGNKVLSPACCPLNTLVAAATLSFGCLILVHSIP